MMTMMMMLQLLTPAMNIKTKKIQLDIFWRLLIFNDTARRFQFKLLRIIKSLLNQLPTSKRTL